MSLRHKVGRWLLALTTKQASYIIVLGIVISLLPINSTISISVTMVGTCNQPNRDHGTTGSCAADIFWNITNCEVQWPGQLIAPTIGPVSLDRCLDDSHNRCSSSMRIICIPPQIVHVHLGVYLATFVVCKEHWLKIAVRLKWEMSQKEVYTSQDTCVVSWSDDMRMIFNPTILDKCEIKFMEEIQHPVCWLECFDFEVVQSLCQILIDSQFRLLAKWLSMLKVVYRPRWMWWSP